MKTSREMSDAISYMRAFETRLEEIVRVHPQVSATDVREICFPRARRLGTYSTTVAGCIKQSD
jgi:hypothetical protein